MNRILSIIKLGNPTLRKRSQRVKEVDSELLDFIDDMMATLKDGNGVGISAPQLNRSLRIIIVASKPSKNYPDAPTMKPKVMINPVVKIVGEKTSKDWEGCLSVSGVRAKVPRFLEVEVSYLSLDGAGKCKKFRGFLARIIQHEYDHLEGLSFLDRVESTRDIVNEDEYQKMVDKKARK
jgi:peptide deformylase